MVICGGGLGCDAACFAFAMTLACSTLLVAESETVCIIPFISVVLDGDLDVDPPFDGLGVFLWLLLLAPLSPANKASHCLSRNAKLRVRLFMSGGVAGETEDDVCCLP